MTTLLIRAMVLSVALTAMGVALLTGMRTSVDPPTGDAVFYLSMVDARPAWAETVVPAPFRYRVAVPWLARQFPFGAATSLSLITYASLAACYFLMLLTCRRLGLPFSAAVGGLLVGYVFEPHLYNYFNPFLIDGFGLLVISAMSYAFVVDSFGLFAVVGVLGVLGREVALLLLPFWCVRRFTWGLGVTAVGVGVLALLRVMLPGPGMSLLDAFSMYGVPRLIEVSVFAKHIRASWGWAIAVAPIGICLLRRPAFVAVGPVCVALIAMAFATAMVAADVNRMFLVLMPVIVFGTAQVIATLMEKRHRMWLALLGGIAATQFCVSGANALLGVRLHTILAVRVPVIRLGTIWAIATLVLVRRELMDGLRQKIHGDYSQ